MSDNKPDTLSLEEKLEAIVEGLGMRPPSERGEGQVDASIAVCVLLAVDAQRKMYDDCAPKNFTHAEVLKSCFSLVRELAHLAGGFRKPVLEAVHEIGGALMTFAIKVQQRSLELDPEDFDSPRSMAEALTRSLDGSTLQRAYSEAAQLALFLTVSEYFSFAQFSLSRKLSKTLDILEAMRRDGVKPEMEEKILRDMWEALKSTASDETGIRKFFTERIDNPSDFLSAAFSTSSASSNSKP